jgi:hypothetical protein
MNSRKDSTCGSLAALAFGLLLLATLLVLAWPQ